MRIKKLVGDAVQSSVTDTTAGRAMLNPAHGLGATDSSAVRFADGETNLPSGFYSGLGGSADVATFPNNNSRYKPFLNLTRRVSTGLYEQLRLFFDADTMYLRHADDAGVWGDPVTFFTHANLLGIVSETGGVPSGAIIERGSNASGEYIRFADGTQICTRLVEVDALDVSTAQDALFYSGVADYSFPATFTAVHHADVSLHGIDNTTLRNSAVSARLRRGSSIASIGWDNICVYSTASVACAAGEKTRYSLYAIGRWF